MITSFLTSLIANVVVLLALSFAVYYLYNKKVGKVRDWKEAIKKFVNEIKEIPSKVSDLLKKLDEIKSKLDALK